MSLIHVPYLQSPENSNDQGSSRASTRSFNTEKIILGGPAAINPNPSPFNDDSLDAIKDDTMKESPSCMS